MDDFELLQAYASRGAEDAFSALVSRHFNRVYSVALLLTRTPTLAEEITQVVFLLLARKAASFRPGPLSGWLLRTTRFTARNARRREQRRQLRERELMRIQLDSFALASPTPEVDLTAVLAEALVGLQEKDRTIIALRFFENRSFKEIGAVLGVGENGARMRSTRALGRMRAFFEQRRLISA